MAITDTWLKANLNKESNRTYNKSDRDGLSVRCSTKGKLTFNLRYYYDNKQRRLDIGTYPLMSLQEARNENVRLRKELEQGHDPKVVRIVEKQIIIEAKTIEQLFGIWYEAYCSKRKKSHHEIKRSFEIYVFPRIGALPVEKVTLHEWLYILEGLASCKPAVAERILSNAKQMLKFAVKRKFIEINVLNDIFAKEDLLIEKGTRDRVLTAEEIRMVWTAIDYSRITMKNKLFVKLCLIYACRNGELRVAEKKHFDFENKIWTIPPENHKLGKKTKKPLLRPITKSTEWFLKQAFKFSPEESPYLFNNDGTCDVMNVGAPVHIPYNIMQYLRRHEGYEIPHFSMHDLRRTARSNFSTICPFHVAEIMLGHSIGKIVQTYDRYDYLKEQSEAYEEWCQRLFVMVKTEKNERVVNLDNVRYISHFR